VHKGGNPTDGMIMKSQKTWLQGVGDPTRGITENIVAYVYGAIERTPKVRADPH
jgi:hypothetical protein